MVQELDSLKNKALRSGQYPYFTDVMVKKYGRMVKGMPPRMVASKLLDYALILVLKGDNQKAIDEINTYLKASNNEKKITNENLFFYKILALAHLRHAEISNCIQHHNAQSCIIPLEGKGIHTYTEGAANAAKIYEQLMDFDAIDLQSKWFLNIAKMGLGQYPDEVDEQYLIPPNIFKSDIEIPTFKNIALEANVALNNHAGGSILEDFDNDGWLDVFTTSYSLGDPSKLYLNQKNQTFDELTDAALLSGFVGGLNTIQADFNNDGWQDIFVTRGAWLGANGKISNSLLMNQGDGTFVDDTKTAGLYSLYPTGTAAVADINLDGHLDIFIGNESTRAYAAPSELYLNQGNGTFKNVAPKLDLEINDYVKSVVWGDINNDRLPDLYISIYNKPNRLYVNRGGTNMDDWQFEEISVDAGVSDPQYSFTSWFWDFDNDGWQDILVFGYDNRKAYAIAENVVKDYLGQPFEGELPRLYKNNGDETFTDVTEAQGLDKLLYVMGGNFGDINNDGYPDFYAGTGEFNIWATVPNRMFLNNKGKGFWDVTTSGGFGMIQKGHGVSFGDFDNDGDQDIYHQVGGAAESDVFHNMLFENPGFGHHWISIDLKGKISNAAAIGTKIEIEIIENNQARTIYHWVNSGGSFGANSLRAEIGLGKATQINSLKVHWANAEKAIQVFEDVAIDQFYQLVEGEDLKLFVFE